jgi:hypothetical protein
MRFLFFLLLVLNAALATHIWLNEIHAPGFDPRGREINGQALKVVAVADATIAARTAAIVSAARQLAESLATAACIELSGVRPGDSARVEQSLAELALGERLSERKVEEASRYWVFIAPAKERKTAEATMAALKKQGIKDVSLVADNSISLGVFSSDDAASRYLAEMRAKGVKGAEKGPRNLQVKEYVFTVREPGTNLVARLTLLQAELAGSELKAVTCPAGAPISNQAGGNNPASKQ